MDLVEVDLVKADLPGPLAGIRVIDLTIIIAGPFGTSLLAALGADVIKIEQPLEGDPIRAFPPSLMVSFNAGKRSVELDLKTDRDRALMWKLIESADVFVTNLRGGAAERLGFGQEDVLARKPDIVCVASTAWGDAGPMQADPGTDHIVRAFSGFCSLSGPEGGDLTALRFLGHADVNSAFYIASAALTGLYARGKVGGMGIRTSMLEAQLAMQSTRFSEYLAGGIAPVPHASGAGVTAPSQAFACGDGALIAVSAETQAQWLRLCGALGRPALSGDPRFASNPERVRHREELALMLGDVFGTRPSTIWLEILRRSRVPASPFVEANQVPNPQIVANALVVPLDAGRVGPINTWGLPWKLRDAPGEMRRQPYKGEHTAEVLAEVDAAMPPHRPPATSAEGTSPFGGLRVLELSCGIAGPYAGALLADHGATVEKLEWGAGDHMRDWGPPMVGGLGTAFLELNRNKTLIRVSDPAAADHAYLVDLARRADVVIVDALDTDGNPPPLTEDEVRAANPAIIWCSVSPYGERGPLAGQPGSELTAQVMTACWSDPADGSTEPVRLGADQGSMTAGLLAYQAVLASLIRRERVGRGDRVEVSVLGAMTCVMGWHWSGAANPEEWRKFQLLNGHTFVRGYRTGDLPVVLKLSAGIGSQERPVEIKELVAVLGGEIPEGMDENAARQSRANPMHADWRPFWEQLFAPFRWDELATIFKEFGVKLVPFTDVSSLDQQPQIEAIQPYATVAMGDTTTRTVKVPWQLSRFRDSFQYKPPMARTKGT